MARGRTGGNPELEKYQFEAGGDEPLLGHLQLRVPLSLKNRLMSVDNWPAFVRAAIMEKLARQTSQTS